MNNSTAPIAVVTIASANYLPFVKTLMQSVRDTNPDYRRYLVLVDEDDLDEPSSKDLFEVIKARSLQIDTFDDMTIRYDVMELNTAVKPFAIDWLFDNTDCSSVIYLDPDIYVYRPLHEIERIFRDGASVIVTPHLTKPLEDGKKPNDEHMLQAGVFNLGFIAVSREAEARAFVAWWGRRLKEACHADFAKNQFTDQRWIDLAPCYLSALHVLRSPAYNVAYWNLIQRPVSTKRNSIFFDGEELAFFHFSGLQFNAPTVVSKHQDRLKWKDITLLHPLFRKYRQQLKLNGWSAKPARGYAYDRVGDVQIAPIVRQLFRDLYPQSLAGISINDEFIIALCNQSAGLRVDQKGQITVLMYKVWLERPDLQTSYPLRSPESIDEFVLWFRATAEREYAIDPRLFPSHKNLKHRTDAGLPPIARPPRPNEERPWLYRRWRKARRWILGRI